MSATTNAAVVKKDVRKSAKKIRVFPVTLRGWQTIITSAYGPSSGCRNWVISEQPSIECVGSNEDLTMYKFKKPVTVAIIGTIIKEDEEQERVHVKCDEANFALGKIIEDHIMEQAREFVDGAKSSENFGARLSPFYGDDMLALKSKYFTGRYTKVFHNGDLTTTIPSSESMKIEIVLQFYGVFAMEDKSAWGPLISIKAFNVITA